LEGEDREEMSRLLELLSGRRSRLHDMVDRALAQIQQAGMAVPKAADQRRLLGALLLAACLPSAGSLAGLDGIEVEPGAKRHLERPSLNLVARSRSGDVIHQCGVRIWQEQEGSFCVEVLTAQVQ